MAKEAGIDRSQERGKWLSAARLELDCKALFYFIILCCNNNIALLLAYSGSVSCKASQKGFLWDVNHKKPTFSKCLQKCSFLTLFKGPLSSVVVCDMIWGFLQLLFLLVCYDKLAENPVKGSRLTDWGLWLVCGFQDARPGFKWPSFTGLNTL